MFYSAKIFKKELGYLTDEQLIHVARVANDVINQQGIVVYGRRLDNNSLHAFSTTKEKTDSTVGIIIGAQEMAIFEPDSSPVKRDLPDEYEGLSKDDFIEQQRRELANARRVIKEMPTPKGPN